MPRAPGKPSSQWAAHLLGPAKHQVFYAASLNIKLFSAERLRLQIPSLRLTLGQLVFLSLLPPDSASRADPNLALPGFSLVLCLLLLCSPLSPSYSLFFSCSDSPPKVTSQNAAAAPPTTPQVLAALPPPALSKQISRLCSLFEFFSLPSLSALSVCLFSKYICVFCLEGAWLAVFRERPSQQDSGGLPRYSGSNLGLSHADH